MPENVTKIAFQAFVLLTASRMAPCPRTSASFRFITLHSLPPLSTCPEHDTTYKPSRREVLPAIVRFAARHQRRIVPPHAMLRVLPCLHHGAKQRPLSRRAAEMRICRVRARHATSLKRYERRTIHCRRSSFFSRKNTPHCAAQRAATPRADNSSYIARGHAMPAVIATPEIFATPADIALQFSPIFAVPLHRPNTPEPSFSISQFEAATPANTPRRFYAFAFRHAHGLSTCRRCRCQSPALFEHVSPPSCRAMRFLL